MARYQRRMPEQASSKSPSPPTNIQQNSFGSYHATDDHPSVASASSFHRDISFISPTNGTVLRSPEVDMYLFSGPDSTMGNVSFPEGPVKPYTTDHLCHRALLLSIMEDYLELLYPVIPVLHRPSFRKDLDMERDSHDIVFRSLLIALSAIVVAIMPSRFREYCSAVRPLRFRSRTEMVFSCYEMLMALRTPQYYDEISHSKWAISYLIGLSFFQVGQQNLCRMSEIESMQFARLLELHQNSSYASLNRIEAQLRRKAFWLMFYGYV